MKKKSIRKILLAINEICEKYDDCNDCLLLNGVCFNSCYPVTIEQLELSVTSIKEYLDNEKNKNTVKNIVR